MISNIFVSFGGYNIHFINKSTGLGEV
jgi:hypothetical protein